MDEQIAHPDIEPSMNTLLSNMLIPTTSLLESIPVPLIIFNSEQAVHSFNKPAKELFGACLKRDFLLQDFLSFCQIVKQNGQDFTHIDQVLKCTSNELTLDLALTTHENQPVFVKMTASALKDDQGRPMGMITSFLTASSELEKIGQFEEAEFRNQELIQSLVVPVYMTDAEGRIRSYNKAATTLWGYAPEIDKDMWYGHFKAYTPDGQLLPLEEYPMAITLKTGKPVYGKELIIRQQNGEEKVIIPNPTPIYNAQGELKGVINVVIDITNTKITEKALRESEERYKQLTEVLERSVRAKTEDLVSKNEQLKQSEERYHKMIEEVEDYAIILLDENGFILNWNRGAEKIKGYKEEEIKGKHFEIFYLPGDRKNKLPERLTDEARTRGKAVYEGWRMRKDGTMFWGSVVLTALHDENDNVIGFSKVTRDLTEKKLAEDRLTESNKNLERQNKELEQFTYAASHDMKEPLRKIIFYNSHIAEHAASRLSEKENYYLSRSVSAAYRMRVLIDDLLEYSKASQSQDFETVDLNEIADEMILNYKDAMEQSGGKIKACRLPVIEGITFQVRQLFDNLVSNSIKYQSLDRKLLVEIDSTLVNGNETLGLDPKTKFYRISFTDNGIGFEPEFKEKIFQLFQRLDVEHTAGTGVGLALCKKIVQNHNGAITALSTLDHGARFDVYLPIP